MESSNIFHVKCYMLPLIPICVKMKLYFVEHYYSIIYLLHNEIYINMKKDHSYSKEINT